MAKKRGNSEGSIYKMQDGRWRAAVMVGWKITPDGKRVPERKIFTGSQRAAKWQTTLMLRSATVTAESTSNLGSRPLATFFLHGWKTQSSRPFGQRPTAPTNRWCGITLRKLLRWKNGRNAAWIPYPA